MKKHLSDVNVVMLSYAIGLLLLALFLIPNPDAAVTLVYWAGFGCIIVLIVKGVKWLNDKRDTRRFMKKIKGLRTPADLERLDD